MCDQILFKGRGFSQAFLATLLVQFEDDSRGGDSFPSQSKFDAYAAFAKSNFGSCICSKTLFTLDKMSAKKCRSSKNSKSIWPSKPLVMVASAPLFSCETCRRSLMIHSKRSKGSKGLAQHLVSLKLWSSRIRQDAFPFAAK